MQFIKDGCTRFVISDVNENNLTETVELSKQLNPKVQIESIVGDITSEEVINALVSRAVIVFGRLDYAVNCAGVAGSPYPIDSTEFSDYQRVMKVNMDALFLCERAEVRAMLKQDLVDG